MSFRSRVVRNLLEARHVVLGWRPDEVVLKATLPREYLVKHRARRGRRMSRVLGPRRPRARREVLAGLVRRTSAAGVGRPERGSCKTKNREAQSCCRHDEDSLHPIPPSSACRTMPSRGVRLKGRAGLTWHGMPAACRPPPPIGRYGAATTYHPVLGSDDRSPVPRSPMRVRRPVFCACHEPGDGGRGCLVYLPTGVRSKSGSVWRSRPRGRSRPCSPVSRVRRVCGRSIRRRCSACREPGPRRDPPW
jgi:hypothetical protein